MFGGQRFHLERVQGGAGNPVFLQRAQQGRFVHDGATSSVDQVGARFHFLQLRLANETAGLWGKRRVQGNEVALGQQLVQRDELDAEAFGVRRRRDVVTEQTQS